MTTRMTARSIRSLCLAAVLCSLGLGTASCSDDGGDSAPDASQPDALVPDALVPDALAPDATVIPECRQPEDCTDGVFCNGEETCTGGRCESASTGACDDGIACTVDLCDEDGKRCRSDANDGLCSNGRFCDGTETCAATGCQGGPPPVTADGVLCRNGRITAGFAHTCALLDSGPVYCWGRADLGQTGHGNKLTIGDNEPASAGNALRFGTEVVVDIEAGDNHTCALLASGNVRCWGFGADGRLGYGNTANLGDEANETPADLPNVNVGGVVTQIAAGGSHTCALLDDGTVRCWGRNANGQLGYGNTAAVGDNESPSAAGPVDVGGTVTQIAAGTNHTCAVLADRTVRCWGLATVGRLGYGNTIAIGDNESPSAAGPVDVGGAVTQIAAGHSHTCALLDTGAVRCWGFAFFGQLGQGNQLDIGARPDRLPSAVGDVPVGGPATEIALGESHTCARLETNAVRCWGRGHRGQLGNAGTDNLGDNEILMLSDIDLGSAAVHLAAGTEHNCVLLENSAVTCWGNAGDGRLGHGDLLNIGDDEAPTAAGDVPLP
jgi:alpha-tubulin suppressor-like RCC1 family protein